MFKINQVSFGKFECYDVVAAVSGAGMSFVPERGACLLSLKFADVEVLDAYRTPEELASNKWGKSGLLFPFPNRLQDGRFEWQGRTYQFPINDRENDNALHGFGMEKPFEVVATRADEHSASVELQYAYDGALPYYPWPFMFTVAYELWPDRFQLTMGARNAAEVAIPFGMGWHPYFQLAETAAAHELRLPPVEMIGIDARMIPTGKRYAYDEFADRRRIGATILDNCFAVDSTGTEATAVLSGARGTLRYRQTTGVRQFNFLQVFTPPYGTSVALEPMTCNVDAFRNREGLTVLAPGEMMSAAVRIAFEAEN